MADAIDIDAARRRLDRARRALGWGYETLADAANVATGTVHGILTGKQATPRFNAVVAMAGALGVPLAEIAGEAGAIVHVDPGEVGPNPDNPRQHFDDGEIAGLAQSIARYGLLSPPEIAPTPDGTGYVLTAGERRWRACRRLQDEGRWPAPGCDRGMPAWLGPADAAARRERALLENAQRVDLSPMELAHAYQALVADGWTGAGIARQLVNTSARHVQQHLALLALPRSAQDALDAGEITVSQARALTRTPTTDQAERALAAIRQGDLRTGPEVEAWLARDGAHAHDWPQRPGPDLSHAPAPPAPAGGSGSSAGPAGQPGRGEPGSPAPESAPNPIPDVVPPASPDAADAAPDTDAAADEIDPADPTPAEPRAPVDPARADEGAALREALAESPRTALRLLAAALLAGEGAVTIYPTLGSAMASARGRADDLARVIAARRPEVDARLPPAPVGGDGVCAQYTRVRQLGPGELDHLLADLVRIRIGAADPPDPHGRSLTRLALTDATDTDTEA